MQCARADKLEGPYETVVISNRETMGTQRGWWTKGYGFWSNIPNEGEAWNLSALLKMVSVHNPSSGRHRRSA